MANQQKKNIAPNVKITPPQPKNPPINQTNKAKFTEENTTSSSSNSVQGNNFTAFNFNTKNPVEQWNQLSEATSSYLNNSTSLFTGNAETVLACTNTALKAAESFISQCIEYSNNLFADNVEISKDFFHCKTITDLIELQSKIFQVNTVATLNETTKLIDTAMAYSKDMAEPLAQCLSDNIENTSKCLKTGNN